ncbi:MAG: PH domain-containing protein [Bacteroidota bacterium]
MTPELPLTEPQRQSPVAVVFILYRYLKRMVRTFFALILIVAFQQGDNTMTYVLTGVIAILAAQLIYALLAYFRYTFYVEGDELIIESGVIGRKRTGIPFDRIQTISFEQNLFHQALDVVQLNIDTAGSAQAELNIDALVRPKAEEIRAFILAQKAAMEGEKATDEGEEESSTPLPSPVEEQEVIHLGLRDLSLIGITENHIRTAGILLGGAFSLYQLVEGESSEAWNKLFDGISDFMIGSSLLLIGSLALTLLIVSFVVSLVRTILQYYDFRLWRTEKGFRINAGLFNRREQAAARNKIQLVKWATNPLRQLMGLSTVRLFQASSQEVKRKQAITIPGCQDAEKHKIVEEIIPSSDQLDYTEHQISRRYVGRMTLYFGIIPAMFFGGITYANAGLWALAWLGFVLLIWAASNRFQKRYRWYINEQTLLIHEGIIASKHTLLAWYKVQSVSIKQSPYQARKDLADLVLYTAAGDVRIPYIELRQAESLRDFVLYQVETTKKDWM